MFNVRQPVIVWLLAGLLLLALGSSLLSLTVVAQSQSVAITVDEGMNTPRILDADPTPTLEPTTNPNQPGNGGGGGSGGTKARRVLDAEPTPTLEPTTIPNQPGNGGGGGSGGT